VRKSQSFGDKQRRPTRATPDEQRSFSGLLFDDRGNRMSPSYTAKKGARYPFYVSSALLRGRASHVGSIRRVPAVEVEGAVVSAVRNFGDLADQQTLTQHRLVEQFIERVIITTKRLVISLKGHSAPIEVAWGPPKNRDLARIENSFEVKDRRTPNPQLVQAVVSAHVWLKSLVDGTCSSIEDLAAAANLHPKVVRSKITLAYLAPELTNLILQGLQPAFITIRGLCKAAGSLSWRDANGRACP